jgi:hypothetical protein
MREDGAGRMTENWLRYDQMVEQALRGVVSRALQEAQLRGLPGDHHFFVTFRTTRPGVGLADWLRQQYPQEMTIVLQHQFWDLSVEAERFSVTLSFGGRHERLTVPFAAISAFTDPSVKFGLQFEAGEEDGIKQASGTQRAELPAVAGGEMPAREQVKTGDVVALDAFRKK